MSPAAAIAGVVALMLPGTGAGHLLLPQWRPLGARGGLRGRGVVGSAPRRAPGLREVEEGPRDLKVLGTPAERGGERSHDHHVT